METNQCKRINIRGVAIDNVNLDEARARVVSFLNEDGVHAVYTPNAEIVQACIEDNTLMELFRTAQLVIPDGAGVVLASRILGKKLKAKTPGYELGLAVAAYAAENGEPVYLCGGKPGVADLAAEKLMNQFPGFTAAGTHDGYFEKTGAQSDAVCTEIAASGAKILFLCLGAPTQEKWIHENREKLGNIRVAIGLGGSFDGYAGIVKRAPRIFIRLRLEWFYRLCKEPRRIGRMMKLPKFVFGTVFYRLFGKHKENN